MSQTLGLHRYLLWIFCFFGTLTFYLFAFNFLLFFSRIANRMNWIEKSLSAFKIKKKLIVEIEQEEKALKKDFTTFYLLVDSRAGLLNKEHAISYYKYHCYIRVMKVYKKCRGSSPFDLFPPKGPFKKVSLHIA